MAVYDSTLPAGGNNYLLRLVVVQGTQNQAGNTSQAPWSLRIIKGAGTGRFAEGPHAWSVNIGGVTYSGTIASYDFRDYSELLLASNTATLEHNSAGYLTASVSGSFDDNNSFGNLGNATSSGSFTFTRIPKPPSAPGTPTAGVVSFDSIPLSWTAPSDNGGSSITSYTVQRATNSSFTTGTSTSTFSGTSGTMTGLSASTTYYFRVRATNAIGTSDWSGVRTATTAPPPIVPPTAPGTPVVGTVTPTSVALTWSAPSSTGGASVTYQLQHSTSSTFSSATTTSTASTSATVSSLSPGYTYYFRVRAQNSSGAGPWSGTRSQTVLLPAPTFTSWTQNASGGMVATWTAPSTTTGLTGYRLQVATNSTFTTDVQNIELGTVLTRTVTGLAGGRTYYARVAALTAGGANTYSSARSHLLILSAGDLNGWTRVGTKPAAISYYTAEGIRRGTVGSTQALWLESLATGAVTLTADTFGIQRTVTGLVVGKSYRFEARATLGASPVTSTSYRLSVVSESSATAVTVTTSGVSLGSIEFVADATSAVIRIMLAQSVVISAATDGVERVAFTGMKLSELSTDYPQRLRSTVFESNLANHFDLACNSVGASWYVAKDGVTRFRLPGAQLPIAAVFSDVPLAGAVSYVDIVAGYDTRTTVNRIEATNYGVDATGNVEDNQTLIVEDASSQATYGLYRSSIAMNLYNVAPYDVSFSNRLTELLAAYKTPAPGVSELRWNAQQDAELASSLEVGDRISVLYRSITYDLQVVSISHDIQPARWMLTLTLQKL